jgi:hypothetical protein
LDKGAYAAEVNSGGVAFSHIIVEAVSGISISATPAKSLTKVVKGGEQ